MPKMFLGYFDDWRDGMEHMVTQINEITANSVGQWLDIRFQFMECSSGQGDSRKYEKRIR